MMTIDGKKYYNPEEGYKLIEYACDKVGNILKPISCVMCKRLAKCIAPETKEPLCLKCKETNDEARYQKMIRG